jgi:hypothetical protein
LSAAMLLLTRRATIFLLGRGRTPRLHPCSRSLAAGGYGGIGVKVELKALSFLGRV